MTCTETSETRAQDRVAFVKDILAREDLSIHDRPLRLAAWVCNNLVGIPYHMTPPPQDWANDYYYLASYIFDIGQGETANSRAEALEEVISESLDDKATYPHPVLTMADALPKMAVAYGSDYRQLHVTRTMLRLWYAEARMPHIVPSDIAQVRLEAQHYHNSKISSKSGFGTVTQSAGVRPPRFN